MKKVLAVSAFAVFGVVALSSCKKDYTCTCTSTINGISSSASTTLNGKKDDVKTACESGNSIYTVCSID